MKDNNWQFVSLKLSKELKEAGYPQAGLWWWSLLLNNPSDGWHLVRTHCKSEGFEYIVAPIEYWVNIPDAKGLYQISNFGQVRRVETSNWKGKIIKANITPNGYYYLDISIGNKRKTIQPHRIMAEVFLPNPHNYPQTNHKNGNKLANWIENLEWCTAKQNTQHAFKTGLRKKYKRNKKGMFTKESIKKEGLL